VIREKWRDQDRNSSEFNPLVTVRSEHRRRLAREAARHECRHDRISILPLQWRQISTVPGGGATTKERSIMAVDMFMRVEGANGESKDSNHKEWTDIKSFAWGATQPGNMVSGGGGGVGKASFNDLQVLARIDKAAPSVLKNCASGQHLGKVEVSVCKAGGSQIEYTRVTLEEVLVTSVQYTAEQGSDAVFVQYSFQAAKVKQQYWEQTDKGGKGAETVLGWNIKENREA